MTTKQNRLREEFFKEVLPIETTDHRLKKIIWSWIESKIKEKVAESQKEMAMKQAVELANLDQQITVLKSENKKLKSLITN